MLDFGPSDIPGHRAFRCGAARLLAVAGVAAVGLAGVATGAPTGRSASAPATVSVLATGLEQPKSLTVAPNGALIVALSGDGVAPASCRFGIQPSCLDTSGAIDEVSTSGQVTRLLSGLPSISSGAGVASGPVEARLSGGTLQVLFQDDGIAGGTGAQPYGPRGRLLGDLASFPARSDAGRIEARFGPFEAAHNPDHGAGTDVARGQESPIDSDPYAFVPYRGGWAVADAGGNDVLFASRTGRVSLFAVPPTISERAAPGSFGRSQTKTIEATAQSVPDAIAVGPDDALYVGELGGVPSDPRTERIYRLVPGHAPTVFARGLTAIGAIAFDPQGRLDVLEIDTKGLSDPNLESGAQTSGALVRIARDGRETTLASRGLEFPTGLAIGRTGTIYVTTQGLEGVNPDQSGSGGDIVTVHPG